MFEKFLAVCDGPLGRGEKLEPRLPGYPSLKPAAVVPRLLPTAPQLLSHDVHQRYECDGRRRASSVMSSAPRSSGRLWFSPAAEALLGGGFGGGRWPAGFLAT